MFELLSGLYHSFVEKQEYRILLLGLENSGKTAMLEKIKESNNQKSIPLHLIKPTIGFNYTKISVKNGKVYIWDLGGGKKVRSLWKNYLPEANCIFYLIDLSDEKRFIESKRHFLTMVLQEEIPNLSSIYLIGTKSDVCGARSFSLLKECFDIENEIMQKYDIQFLSWNCFDKETTHHLHTVFLQVTNKISGVRKNSSLTQ